MFSFMGLNGRGLFQGGVHPPELKQTAGKPIEEMPAPETVIIHLKQHIGAPLEPLVKAGDKVLLGEKIADTEAFVSAPVHATVSGVVKEISPKPYAIGHQMTAAVIESDGRDRKHKSFKARKNPDKLAPDEIKNIVREAGIVGLGGAMFPTHVKLSPPEGKHLDTLIINGSECEPYLSCDSRLMLERAGEVLSGARLIMKAAGIEKCVFGVEENKPDAIEELRHANDDERIKIAGLPVKYPQGAEKILTKVLTGREIPSGALPLDVGVIVDNVGTAVAVHEAVAQGKPLIDRVLTVAGPGVAESKNLSVRIGTPVEKIIEHCGGYNGAPAKIFLGGPMMGLAQYTDQVPTIKGNNGVIVFNEKTNWEPETQACIKCGRCINACPYALVPWGIEKAADAGQYALAEKYGALDCMECGACAYECPSGRPLVHKIKYAKLRIMEAEIK